MAKTGSKERVGEGARARGRKPGTIERRPKLELGRRNLSMVLGEGENLVARK